MRRYFPSMPVPATVIRTGLLCGATAALVLTYTACKPRSSSALRDAAEPVGKHSASGGGLNFCAAVRGNGTFIFTHFGALARILEDYGELDAVAGGSSGAATGFLYESMAASTAITPTRGKPRDLELALLMKSMMGVVDAVGQSPQVQAIVGLTQLVTQVRAQGLEHLAQVDAAGAAAKLQLLLRDPNIRDLINPVALAMLANTDKLGYASYEYKVRELVKAAQVVTAFDATDRNVLFREGVFSYPGFARALGAIGNFYAGVDDANAALLKTFVDSCRDSSRGHTWAELRGMNVAGGTCGGLFKAAVDDFWGRSRGGRLTVSAERDRLHQPLGATVPVLAPTAILNTAAAVADYNANLARYRAGQPVDMQLRFADVKFGYFVPQGLASTLTANLRQPEFADDAKVGKVVILNPDAPVTWETVLNFSPLEPGLGRIVPISAERAYIGGWGDLHPTQMLRAAGCDKVIYISRRGPETAFVTQSRTLKGVATAQRQGVAELLYMTADEQHELYDPQNDQSSYRRAVAGADAVWCTDWDSAETAEQQYMFDHAYGKIVSKTGFATRVAVNRPDSSGFFATGVPVLTEPTLGCSK
jgi:hypothetical protein